MPDPVELSAQGAVIKTAIGMTTFGASLTDDADAAAGRATLGLGTAAVEAATAFATPAQLTAVTINAQTGTTYTLALADAGRVVTMANASANVLTVPANATVALPVETIINVLQKGAGVTTITGAAGVTINGSSAGSVAISAQWQGVSLLKIATDDWIVSGALE